MTLALLSLALVGGALAYSEYRTNWFARWMGGLLADTNARRRPTGTVWQQLQGHKKARKTLDQAPPDEAPEIPTGLPEAVARNRFELTRIPESGLPSYIALWTTSLTPEEREGRPVHDVISSLRFYRQGLPLLETIDLPDVRYRARVRRQIDHLYQQAGDIVLEPAEDDTLAWLSPDSLKAAVYEELGREMFTRFEAEEHARLVADFQAGRIYQIELHQGLGSYRGELIFHDPQRSAVTFTLSPESVARAFNLQERVDAPF